MRTARVCVPGVAGIVSALVQGDGHAVLVGGRPVPCSQVRFEPAADGLVYGAILNDHDALRALGEALNEPPYKAPPQAPILYIKPYNTHVGHGAVVHLPEGAEQVEILGALGIVFGAPATRVTEARALEPVRGFTVVTDLSLPQESLYRPPIREKCFDGACPMGPWVVDRDEVADPAVLEVSVTVNGALRQRRKLSGLIRSVPRLIADVTEFMTLHPGDVLLAGVPVAGPLARAGETLAVEIAGIGRLENRIEAAP
jgi:5-oxopent-3-ene-1,2,5-tricarboxylate decarboxylase/2-hydroxyhepta-2,4-diene-1,7-dioate isomerase